MENNRDEDSSTVNVNNAKHPLSTKKVEASTVQHSFLLLVCLAVLSVVLAANVAYMSMMTTKQHENISTLTTEKRQLVVAKQAMKSQIDQLDQDKNWLLVREEFQQLRKKLTEDRERLSRELLQMGEDREKLSKEREELRRGLNELITDRKNLTQEREKLTREREKLTEDREKLNQDTEKMRLERDELSRKRKELNKAEEELNKEKEDLDQNIDNVNKEKEELRKEKGVLNKAKDKVMRDRERVRKERERVRREQEQLGSYKDLSNKTGDLEKEKERLEKEKEELRKNRTEVNNQKEELRKEKEEHNKGVEVLRKRKEELRKKKEELRKRKEELRKKKAELIKEKVELNKNEDQLNKEKEELRKQKEELRKQKEELSKQKEERSTKKEELIKAIEEQSKEKEELNKLKVELNEKKEELNERKVEINKGKEELLRNKNELSKMANELNKEQQELNKELQNLRKLIKEENDLCSERNSLEIFKTDVLKFKIFPTAEFCPRDMKPKCRNCRDGWLNFMEHCYFISDGEDWKSWNESRKICQENGGDLLIINFLEEQFTRNKMQKRFTTQKPLELILSSASPCDSVGEDIDLQPDSDFELSSDEETLPLPKMRARLGSELSETAKNGTVWREEQVGTHLHFTPIEPYATDGEPSAKARRSIRSRLQRFLCFITLDMLRSIQEWTTQHARHTEQLDWFMDLPELMAFISVIILRGVTKVPSLCDSWSANLANPRIIATMARNRFQDIMRRLRFDGMFTCSERAEAAISDVWRSFVTNCIASYNPRRHIPIDEQLFPSKTRCCFLQYIATKPDKFGIKFWVACDLKSKYICNVFPYLRKDPSRPSGERLSETVVMRLMEPFMDKGRTVTTDNFFTSLSLAQRLLSCKTTILGTVNKRQREIPQSARQMDRTEFTTQVFSTTGATLTVYAPKRKNKHTCGKCTRVIPWQCQVCSDSADRLLSEC